MGLHAIGRELAVQKKNTTDIVVALAGNPNVGKSTVFNAMTGLRQHTGNWPGKTVANAQGYCIRDGQGYVVVDIPGCYSLSARSREEEIAGNFIRSAIPDVVVVVCDAVCLERSLCLALQIMEETPAVVLCVNLMDEAEKKHIAIDREKLEKRLQIPVVGTAARSRKGIGDILDAAKKVRDKENRASRESREIGDKTDCRSNYRTGKESGRNPADKFGKDAEYYVKKAEEICCGAVRFEDTGYASGDRKKDRLFTGKFTAFPIMFLLLLLVFWLTAVGANYPSSLLQKALFGLEDGLYLFCIRAGMPLFLREMLIHGMYRVVAWVVSVMLPPMAIFFPLFTILEDSGYLPRVAFNLDRCFQKCRACGKQALTMCMGFGCNAAGVTGCRIIDSPRERLIAIITNNFVPCNGRFPTLLIIITMFFAGGAAGAGSSFLAAAMLAGFIVLGIAMTFLVSRILSATVLKGVPSSFVLELPPYRRPQIGRVIVRSLFDRTLFVLGRAIAAAAPAGLILWLAANVRVRDLTVLSLLSGALDPFASQLGMDGTILLAFILGLPANEIVVPIIIMGYLAQGTLSEINDVHVLKQLLVENGWTWVTAISTMLFSLMHWPCSTTCLTIHKETGSLKWTLVSFLVPTAAGVIVCFLFTRLAGLFSSL